MINRGDILHLVDAEPLPVIMQKRTRMRPPDVELGGVRFCMITGVELGVTDRGRAFGSKEVTGV